MYHEGGYDPVHLHDQYSDGRYRYVHQLGFGSYATLWLVRDQPSNCYVAFKIVVAVESKTGSEGEVLLRLGDAQVNHPSNCCVNSVSENFSIDRPTGRRLCLMIARYSIAESKEASVNWMFSNESCVYSDYTRYIRTTLY